tara:strand:+ start:2343 stop:2516 length:174 start_codon:yes stop_codon:yes gene_type:complete
VSNIIKTINPEAIISGNNTPPRSGAFEIKINEKLVYSKLDLGTFPNKSDIQNFIEKS